MRRGTGEGGREAQKASDDESGAGSAGDVQRGHKHIVALNTSGGYTVIKSGKVIQRAALPWGWTFATCCSSPAKMNLAGDIILPVCECWSLRAEAVMHGRADSKRGDNIRARMRV